MKKLLIILAIIIICILCTTLLVNEESVHKDVSTRICKESIVLNSSDPTSVKINKISNVSSNLNSQEIDDWIKNQNYSETLTKSLIDPSFKKSMKKIYISIDYSSNESFIGASRNEFLCGFVIDIFGNNIFETITYKNKDYKANEVFLYKNSPSRYNSNMSKLGINSKLSSKLTFLDKLIFILTLPF